MKVLLSSAILALAAAQSAHWIPVNGTQLRTVTEALSVGFATDGKTGYMGVGLNGVGPEVWKTVDAGVTWTSEWPGNDTKVGFDLFLAAACKEPTAAVVTGVLFQVYTQDGVIFESSDNDFLAPAQDGGVLPNGDFAITLSGSPGKNGPATSKTGEAWTNHNMNGVNASIFAARYSSYPTDTTWYVNAGCFPSNNDNSDLHRVNMRYSVDKRTGKQHVDTDFKLSAPPVPCSQDPTNCFAMGIYKTTDGGKTYNQMWSDEKNNIYGNGISCFDENTCVAVFEGDTCGILVTVNGGKSWTQTHNDTNAHCSLTYVHMISAKEIWVAGGLLQSVGLQGRFYHSVDGGNTWTLETIRSFYVFDLDMWGNSGFAVGLEIAAGSGVELLQYNPNGVFAETM